MEPADEPTVFLKELHEAEVAVARGLRAVRAGRSRLRDFDSAKAIEWLAQKKKIELSPTQSVAVGNALKGKVAVITGGPGPGKTTINRAIVEITEALKGRVVLAAPTGRAAKRLSEACGREAKTLHRLLEIRPGASARFSAARLDPDVMVVDEAGMIDVQMMATIAQSLASHTHLILVGDVDQLPSVGPGSVLRDLIECGEIPVSRL
ncbi:MAG: AAA family ATPase, partial [Deltaproteobacteria bacterium]|nr:AAA family ATPase [Deltaproteobacteria bacterium]